MSRRMSRRHPDVDRLCASLHDIVVGRAAAELLKAGRPDPRARVAVLPTWGWAKSNIGVGKKDRDPAGGHYLLPVRYTYPDGPVRLVRDEPITTTYTGNGMGHQVNGHTALTRTMAEGAATDTRLRLPEQWGTLTGAPATVLNHLVEAGTAAYWDTLNYLERLSHKAIARAAQSLRYEVDEQVPGQMLDPEALDTVKTRLVYGEAGSAKASSMARLIERCVRPSTFVGGDPGHYVSMAVNREAMQAVRSALGDPRSGSRIRRLSAELAEANDGAGVDPLTLITAYQERFPADTVHLRHVLVALTLRPSPHSGALPLLPDLESPSPGEAA